VESLASPSSSFCVGDEILLVEGKRLSSVKAALKAFKSAAGMKVVWRIRRKVAPSIAPAATPLPDLVDLGDGGTTATAADLSAGLLSAAEHERAEPASPTSRQPTPSPSRRNSFDARVAAAAEAAFAAIEKNGGGSSSNAAATTSSSSATEETTTTAAAAYSFKGLDGSECRVFRTLDLPCTRVRA
jgi:hypothetical protein